MSRMVLMCSFAALLAASSTGAPMPPRIIGIIVGGSTVVGVSFADPAFSIAFIRRICSRSPSHL